MKFVYNISYSKKLTKERKKMISMSQKVENLENILENLEAALALYKQNAYFYENEINALSKMIEDINQELMEY